ncbi:HlyD family type I secretion periplasmic adaptor subunit [Gallaecimonas kandeliae]|uniref:HlyD family type I secretion periplasmic adaptor subunit n=1 Tax=Gallaecimonas kandeliae TaxID=3029055 RepID=UPI002648A1FC|nr:HlyD family type I secretion periplasmic adaptor subunit [Gallaecimonas kandeliae]WKE65127.1 HlyD family type I secretion periplasmic adaptor subunit [Gallaecimonas kandeliae]
MSEQWALDSQSQLMNTQLRYHRILLWIMALLMGCFLIWATQSQLEEVARGKGKVIPSQQLQVVQSVDGGVVEAIYVHEGQMVEAGQPLLRINDVRFQSDYRQKTRELVGLQSAVTRLDAELKSVILNNDAPDWHQQVQVEQQPFTYPEDFKKDYPELVSRQASEYRDRLTNLGNQLSILGEQITQRQQELSELDAKISHQQESLALATKELELTEPLAAQGVVSEVELLKLRRQINDMRGELAMAKTNKPKVIAAREEAIFKRRDAALQFRTQVQEELRRTELQLNSQQESTAGLEDKVARTQLVSPVKGTVKTLHVNTVGAVVQAGTPVVEIVPLEGQLLVEARISPRDIAFLRPGQPAVVRLTAYDFAIYGSLKGILDHISADSLVDDDGNAYYLIRVRTEKPYIVSGKKELPIIPGMLTEVDVITGEHSVLDYLLKPILRARTRALRER